MDITLPGICAEYDAVSGNTGPRAHDGASIDFGDSGASILKMEDGRLDNPYKWPYCMVLQEGRVDMAYSKKTIELDDAVLKKLRRQLDVKTDKEAVNLAMQIVTDEGDIIAVHQQLAGKLDLDGPFS